MRQLLGKHPGKKIHRIGIALGSFWITINIINFIWQNPVNNNSQDLEDQINQDINTKKRLDI